MLDKCCNLVLLKNKFCAINSNSGAVKRFLTVSVNGHQPEDPDCVLSGSTDFLF